jgi:formate dehydrogenase subunit gamma
MIRTLGSRARPRGPEVRFVRRFSRTERTLHWANAIGFFVLLASGLVLYVPALSMAVGRRALLQEVHFYSGLAWIGLLVLIAAAGDRRGLIRTATELDAFDHDDLRWLIGRRPAPQGRFNAGQKINAALTTAITVLFLVSGLLMWFGERDTNLRFASTILLHDALMFVSVVLVTGHIYLASLHPPTRHSLRGMTRGTVREDWARQHHPRWRPELEDPPSTSTPGRTSGSSQAPGGSELS